MTTLYASSTDGIHLQGFPLHLGHREIKKGDCILLGNTKVCEGYWDQLVRMISVGGEALIFPISGGKIFLRYNKNDFVLFPTQCIISLIYPNCFGNGVT
jgi:hypothetical protein